MTDNGRTITSSAPLLNVGQCESCGLGAASAGRNSVPCVRCNATVRLSRVRGTYKGEIVCDSRCQFAVGPSCDCSCGGPNHGIGYVASYLYDIPGEVVERDTKRYADKLAKRDAKKAAKAAELAREREEWLSEGSNREATEYAAAKAAECFTPYCEEFFCSIARQFDERGYLSDRQVDAVLRGIERDKRDAERDAAKVALVESGVKCPEGKVTIEGEIVSTRVDDGYYGTTVKALVVTEAGWKVWGTKPSAASKGDRIRFVATVTPSADDPLFGFYKRPTKVEII